MHVHLLIPVTSPRESVCPDEGLPYCRGEGAVGGKRSNDFTCSLLVQGYFNQGDMEAASVKEAKEEVSDLTLQQRENGIRALRVSS